MNNSFSDWLIEGAISISSDMTEFAEKAFDELEKRVHFFHGDPDVVDRNMSEKILNHGSIKNGKFGEFKGYCKFVMTKGQRNAGFDTNKNVVRVYLKDRDIVSIFTKNDNYQNVKDFFLKSVKHELVHAFDPKVKNLTKTKKEKIDEVNKKIVSFHKKLFPDGIDNLTPEERQKLEKEFNVELEKYAKYPWEVDAYMSTEAEEKVARLVKSGQSFNTIKRRIENIQPSSDIEKIYYNSSKLWKRYLSLIYKLLEAAFDKTNTK